MVPWIPTAEFLSYLDVALGPERREVECDLHRPVGGRQQVHNQRHPTVVHGRRGGEPEELLKANGEHRTALCAVVDRNPAAGWHLDVGRYESIEVGALLPVQQRVDPDSSRQRSEIAAPERRPEVWGQPSLQGAEQRRIVDRRPGIGLIEPAKANRSRQR